MILVYIYIYIYIYIYKHVLLKTAEYFLLRIFKSSSSSLFILLMSGSSWAKKVPYTRTSAFNHNNDQAQLLRTIIEMVERSSMGHFLRNHD